jgi:hypothetical protein
MYFNDLIISMFEIGPLKLKKLNGSRIFKYSKDMTIFCQLPIYMFERKMGTRMSQCYMVWMSKNLDT